MQTYGNRPLLAGWYRHDFSGWIVFVFAFAMMLVLQRVIAWIAPRPKLPTSPVNASATA